MYVARNKNNTDIIQQFTWTPDDKLIICGSMVNPNDWDIIEVDEPPKTKYIGLLGNMTFEHNLIPDELVHFKSNSERKCLVHDIDGVLIVEDRGKLLRLCEDLCENAYVVVGVYNGEIAYENDNIEKMVKTIFEINLTN